MKNNGLQNLLSMLPVFEEVLHVFQRGDCHSYYRSNYICWEIDSLEESRLISANQARLAKAHITTLLGGERSLQAWLFGNDKCRDEFVKSLGSPDKAAFYEKLHVTRIEWLKHIVESMKQQIAAQRAIDRGV